MLKLLCRAVCILLSIYKSKTKQIFVFNSKTLKICFMPLKLQSALPIKSAWNKVSDADFCKLARITKKLII